MQGSWGKLFFQQGDGPRLKADRRNDFLLLDQNSMSGFAPKQLS